MKWSEFGGWGRLQCIAGLVLSCLPRVAAGAEQKPQRSVVSAVFGIFHVAFPEFTGEIPERRKMKIVFDALIARIWDVSSQNRIVEFF
jgi:hypothetical protein